MNYPESIFTDGGVIGPNPSKHGGTWCWCWVSKNVRTRSNCGIATPESLQVEAVTNNQTELLAAVNALTSVPKGWDGTLYTDSVVTQFRLTNGESFNGVPQWLRLLALDLRRARKYKVVLIKGHATQKEIAAGLSRCGKPTSCHNTFCDEQCTKLAWDFLKNEKKHLKRKGRNVS